MNHPTSPQKFWQAYLETTQKPSDTTLYEIFHFDDNKNDANTLAALVVAGRKLGTASLLWEYQSGAGQAPKKGDLSVVTDWSGNPQCVIETTVVEVVPFKDVTEAFAASEGEGDLSLAFWREVHWRYFGRVCKLLNRQCSQEMMVVCENFRVVYLKQ